MQVSKMFHIQVLGMTTILALSACGPKGENAPTSTDTAGPSAAATAKPVPSSQGLSENFDDCTFASKDEVASAIGVPVSSWIPSKHTCLYNFSNANHELSITSVRNLTPEKAQRMFSTYCMMVSGPATAGIGDEACVSAKGAAVRKGVNLAWISLMEQDVPGGAPSVEKLAKLVASRLP